MARTRSTLLLALSLCVLLPATAMAKPVAKPLVNVSPLGSYFKDRVSSSSPRLAHASLSADWHTYQAPDGTKIVAAISSGYANALSTSVAQSYVDFLDTLPHGPELSLLKVYIAPPAEVTTQCGGQDGVLACYDSGTKIMVVPGQQTDTGTDGVTTSYVITHEYGHHIATFRSNSPFNAFRFGPKFWSSYELVCDRATRGLLAPGDESVNYLSNPGEGWAETYARLTYPDVKWQFNPIMAPDAGALAAAQKDVLNPWQSNVTQVYKSSFGAHGANTKRFSFDLSLDGRLTAKILGPRGANYDLVLSSDGRDEGRTHTAGSRDSVSYAAACRQRQTEHVTVAVRRVRGSGPFTLRLSYAG